MQYKGMQVNVVYKTVKKLSLTFTPPARFQVSAPYGCHTEWIRQFILSSSDWMKSCIERMKTKELHGDFTFDGMPVKVTYKSMKSVRLKVESDGQLLLSAPYGISRATIQDFLTKNQERIRKMCLAAQQRLEEREKEQCHFQDGDSLRFLGRVYHLQIQEYPAAQGLHPCVKVNEAAQTMRLCCPQGFSLDKRRQLVFAYVSRVFGERVNERMAYWTKKMGIRMPLSLYFSPMRSRWGVCYPDKKRIGLSLNLIPYSIETIEAVLVHELCHLRHAGHGKDFYDCLLGYLPNYWEHYNQLKHPVTPSL